MNQYTIHVNGHAYQIEAQPDMPLLWVLRDRLGLIGTKYGCGIGQCGACTVHLDGQAMRSCQVPLSELGNRPVRTIEGLAEGNQLHPVQQAWIDEDVAQCGYCQSGQIMAAVALLNEHPKPTDTDIDAAMTGNYCRCGTYIRIRAAIHRAAAAPEATSALRAEPDTTAGDRP